MDKSKTYGDGVAWLRGAMIGKGSFGCVYLATLRKPKSRYSYFPSVMAVKSAEVSVSGSIQKEGEVLNNVKGCSSIIQCYGEEPTTGENGMMVYNLLLEYGSGGNLADRIKKFGGDGLAEFEVRGYTKSILKGLNHVHINGYVHCDLKPENILLVNNLCKGGFRAKIGDFGLAKRGKKNKKRKLEPYFRGTPLYLSPEAVLDCIQEGPADVWALGCIVLEMLTGKPPWVGEENLDAAKILKKIGEGNELPKIPSKLSEDAQSFLKGCFVRNPMYRLTADMLLNHPFVEGLIDDDDGPEEFPVVEDVLGVESILFVAESDDDILYSDGSLSDYSEYASDGDDSYSYSGDDAEDSEEDIESTFSEEDVTKEGILNITESTSDAKADHTAKSTSTVPLPGNTSSSPQFPVNLTIRAGV